VPLVPESPYGDLIETTMRVVTWNVWGRLADWEARCEAITQTLARIAPDVVVLQESWAEPSKTQAGQIADRLGLEAAFARDVTYEGIDVGVALLSRWDLHEVESRPLPVPAGEKPENVVLKAEVAGPRGPFLVFGTHLAPFPHRSQLRQEQVRALASFVADCQPQPYPAIVCGDFNAPPESDEIRLLTGVGEPAAPNLVFFDAWSMAGDGSPGYTVARVNPNASPLLMPDLRWDYIFVSWPSGLGGAGHPVSASLEGTDESNGVVPSDHYAVVADLRY